MEIRDEICWRLMLVVRLHLLLLLFICCRLTICKFEHISFHFFLKIIIWMSNALSLEIRITHKVAISKWSRSTLYLCTFSHMNSLSSVAQKIIKIFSWRKENWVNWHLSKKAPNAADFQSIAFLSEEIVWNTAR